MKLAKKKTVNVFGKDYYFLGKGKDGINYYLEKESWDCNWYWSLGYIEAFTNNNCPEKSRDIQTHTHFDSLFLRKDIGDSFFDFFETCVLNKEEAWKLLELFSTAYKLRETAAIFTNGGAHITTNPCEEVLKDDLRAGSINEVVLPALFKEIHKLVEVNYEK